MSKRQALDPGVSSKHSNKVRPLPVGHDLSSDTNSAAKSNKSSKKEHAKQSKGSNGNMSTVSSKSIISEKQHKHHHRNEIANNKVPHDVQHRPTQSSKAGHKSHDIEDDKNKHKGEVKSRTVIPNVARTMKNRRSCWTSLMVSLGMFPEIIYLQNGYAKTAAKQLNLQQWHLQKVGAYIDSLLL
jgi:hypothetical protein